MIIQYICDNSDDNKKLKDILNKRLYISKELIKKLKFANCIYVNDKCEFVNYILKQEDRITVDLEKYQNIKTDKKFEDKFELLDKELDILYEDDYLLIVNKPCDMPCHPSADNYTNTLSNIVASYLKKQGIYNIHLVTRLDKNTTGVCIFAKNEYIQELFTRLKDKLKLSKEYIAIVNGIVEKDKGIIEKNIDRMKDTIILRECVDNTRGDYAKTEYSVLNRNTIENYTVLNVKIYTGRTHQIRVHMIDLGHILLGDTLYAEFYNIDNIDKLISRQALHAHKVSFIHPITKNEMVITAPLPQDMEKLVNSNNNNNNNNNIKK